MTEEQLIDIMREGLWAALVVSLPILGVALLVGVLIGLFQALTSVQELTLTFVPKLAAILVAFWSTMGYSGALLVTFYQERILALIAAG